MHVDFVRLRLKHTHRCVRRGTHTHLGAYPQVPTAHRPFTPRLRACLSPRSGPGGVQGAARGGAEPGAGARPVPGRRRSRRGGGRCRRRDGGGGGAVGQRRGAGSRASGGAPWEGASGAATPRAAAGRGCCCGWCRCWRCWRRRGRRSRVRPRGARRPTAR